MAKANGSIDLQINNCYRKHNSAKTSQNQLKLWVNLSAWDLADATEGIKRFATIYQETAPRLVPRVEENIPDGLTVFSLPEGHRKRMRTTNMLERQNRELKRRTRVATLFPNEASLLRLATAVLAEISDEWETGPMSYLTFKNQQ